MIKIKSLEEIEIMAEGGRITSGALQEVLKYVKPGVATIDLDKIAEEQIVNSGAKPSFKFVDNYPFTTCININEGIVHGMPNNYRIRKGDLVSIDLGSFYKGFHTDLSYTVEVGSNVEEVFLSTGKTALEKAINMCRTGKRIGDVSSVIQQEVEAQGYTASEMLVGHGIGRNLHEDPYVPCIGVPGTGPKLKEGMVLAIEIIYQKGAPFLSEEADGWTLRTTDRSLAGLFEKTVAITNRGPVILTDF